MITSVKVTNYIGKTMVLSLRDPWENGGVAITSITGLGPQKAKINTVEVSTKDGSFYNSSRIEQRNIVLNLRYLDDRDISDTRRTLIYEFFHIKRQVTLEFESISAMHSKPFTCRITGYVESNENDMFKRTTDAQISIICPDPMFYDTTESARRFVEFSDEDPGFEFVPNLANGNGITQENSFAEYVAVEDGIDMFELTVKNNNHTAILEYGGDGSVGVVMQIEATGPVTNPAVYCNNVEMKFICNLVSGNVINISTIRGRKRVTIQNGNGNVNAINYLANATKWIQLEPGFNELAYGADSGSENLRITIEAETTYEGI